MHDLPPDLPRLRTLRMWHAVWLERIDQAIAAAARGTAAPTRPRLGPRTRRRRRRPTLRDPLRGLLRHRPAAAHHHPRASPRSARRRGASLCSLPTRHGARGAVTAAPAHSGLMDAPIVVHPPSPTGGRRVTARGHILGMAHSDHDLLVFLEAAGLHDPELIIDDPQWVEWRGGLAHQYEAA